MDWLCGITNNAHLTYRNNAGYFFQNRSESCIVTPYTRMLLIKILLETTHFVLIWIYGLTVRSYEQRALDLPKQCWLFFQNRSESCIVTPYTRMLFIKILWETTHFVLIWIYGLTVRNYEQRTLDLPKQCWLFFQNRSESCIVTRYTRMLLIKILWVIETYSINAHLDWRTQNRSESCIVTPYTRMLLIKILWETTHFVLIWIYGLTERNYEQRALDLPKQCWLFFQNRSQSCIVTRYTRMLLIKLLWVIETYSIDSHLDWRTQNCSESCIVTPYTRMLLIKILWVNESYSIDAHLDWRTNWEQLLIVQ